MTVRKECDASACGSSENLGAAHARVQEVGDQVVFFCAERHDDATCNYSEVPLR